MVLHIQTLVDGTCSTPIVLHVYHLNSVNPNLLTAKIPLKSLISSYKLPYLKSF